MQIVGDTLPQYQKYLDKLKLNIKNKGLVDRIEFMGFRKDINSILYNSNFFVHTPTMPDPFPTVIFESIQNLTPIITNDMGGAFEILDHGKNGLIIKNDEIEKSVKKVLKYLNNKNIQKKNIEKAFDYVTKNFSFDSFKNNILNIVE